MIWSYLVWSPVIDISEKFALFDLYDLYDLYDVAHVAGWEPYYPHDMLGTFPGLGLYCTDPAHQCNIS